MRKIESSIIEFNKKMRLKLILILSFISTISYSQQTIVNKNINVLETKISVEESCFQGGRLYCYDIIKNDTTKVFVSKVGFTGYTFELIMFDGRVIPKVIKWTDTNSYDGKSSVELETASYTLEINNKVFKPGDTLKARFTIETKKHKYSDKKIVSGKISHVIGGNQYEWRGGKPFHDKTWKNGKRVYTVPESKKD